MQGMDVTDEELLEYISESSTMSKAMDDYDGERCLPPHAHIAAHDVGDGKST